MGPPIEPGGERNFLFFPDERYFRMGSDPLNKQNDRDTYPKTTFWARRAICCKAEGEWVGLDMRRAHARCVSLGGSGPVVARMWFLARYPSRFYRFPGVAQSSRGFHISREMVFMAISDSGGGVKTRIHFAPEGEKAGEAYYIKMIRIEIAPQCRGLYNFCWTQGGAPAHRGKDTLCR